MSRGKFYTPEFKEQAVKRVIEGSEQISKVARELGVNDKTIGGWVSAYRRKNAGRPLPADMPEQDRVRELDDPSPARESGTPIS